MSSSPRVPGFEPPLAVDGQVVAWGPQKVRNEHRWGLVLADGSRAVLGQLLPELAGEPPLRRRYVYEVERLVALDLPCVAPTLAWGPQPDPRDDRAAPPWRLRADPDGQSLADWIAARAPAPIDESLGLVAALADAVHQVHATGAVLRDLEPRCAIVAGSMQPKIWLVDVGLARLDILSSRTASSLMLESSPYSAPEHLRATVVDLRADVFTLGVILWQAVTGVLPFGDEHGVLRRYHALPPLTALRPDAPPELAELLARILAEDPEWRPDSARDVAAALRGERASPSALTLASVPCQACGAAMRPGLRLCLACGKTAVRYAHVSRDAAQSATLLLVQASEDEEFVRKLREFFARVAEVPPARLDFLLGDSRMYSGAERKALQRLPAPLLTDLSPDTAAELAGHLRERGFAIKIQSSQVPPRRTRAKKYGLGAGLAGLVLGSVMMAGASLVAGAVVLGVGAAAAISAGVSLARDRRSAQAAIAPMATLRAAPAALPSSDPYVLRMAALLELDLAADVRERVAELALLLQRLSDHRQSLADAAELAALLDEPLDRACELIAHAVTAIAGVDRELADLDEGALSRAIAAAEARRDPPPVRAELLAGLDKLRALEDLRAQHMQRLLEAASLLGRAVELGLHSRDPDALESSYLELALAALGEPAPR